MNVWLMHKQQNYICILKSFSDYFHIKLHGTAKYVYENV